MHHEQVQREIGARGPNRAIRAPNYVTKSQKPSRRLPECRLLPILFPRCKFRRPYDAIWGLPDTLTWLTPLRNNVSRSNFLAVSGTSFSRELRGQLSVIDICTSRLRPFLTEVSRPEFADQKASDDIV